jgi:hypothetical protein
MGEERVPVKNGEEPYPNPPHFIQAKMGRESLRIRR